MGCTWKDCEGQAHTEVTARCAGDSFPIALQVVAEYLLAVVNSDHSNPEKYAQTVLAFMDCLALTSKLWNESARKYWPRDGRVTIGNRTANSTAVAAMEYFHDVKRFLFDGPMADAKAYGENEITAEQLKRFKQSMLDHFSEAGIPAKPGDVIGIWDNIILSIGIEADSARSSQASIACKRLEHLRELFLHVNEDPKLLTEAMVEGGIMLVPLIELGSIPNNEVFRDYIEAARKQPVPHFDNSVSDFSYRCMFQLAADMFSDKWRTILHKLSDNGEGVSYWSTSNDDTKRQSHQYASFCAELVEFLSVPSAAPVVVRLDPIEDDPPYSLDVTNRTLEWFGRRFESIERNPFEVIRVLYVAFEKGSQWVTLDKLRNLCPDVRALDRGMAEVFIVRVETGRGRNKKRVNTKHPVYEFIEKRGGAGATSYRLRPMDEIPV